MQVNEKNFPYITTPANIPLLLQNQTKWLINTLQQKQNWEKVELGTIVDEISVRIDSTNHSKYDKFIGLENLVSGNLKANQYTTTQNIVSAMKVFQKKDILYARRNAYLKRTSLVEFDGICSGDATVLRRKTDNVVNNFLVILLNTDTFHNYAISYAAGSTSTRAKFRDLAKFQLPPLPIQQQIADLLWSIEDQITATQQTQTALQQLKKKLLHQLFSPSLTDNNNSPLFELQKEDFKQVKFGEVVQQISEQVKPQTTNLTIYIGLEHLEPEQLSITSFGKPSDVEGIKLRAYKGDIIFGKRRAYQRKAAICDVDAIVSAHAMILRANPEKILPNFLPFFMQSDEFMDRAVSISEGSLSPTIKWNVLAKQEFHLPPLSIQGQLAALFNHLEQCLQEAVALTEALQGLKKGLINSLM